jgi:hypothetical protein
LTGHDGERQRAEHGRQGRHHDGAQAQHACGVDRLRGALPVHPLRHQRDVMAPMPSALMSIRRFPAAISRTLSMPSDWIIITRSRAGAQPEPPGGI